MSETTTRRARSEAVEAVLSVPYWRQRIPIPTADGVVHTPGRSTPAKFNRFGLTDDDLRGARVLDVGAWDGLHSFLAEQRGAASVLATDVWERGTGSDDPDHWSSLRKEEADAGIETARRLRGSSIDRRHLSVYDLTDAGVGPFDLVLFPSVLYHLENPMRALREVAAVTRDCAVVETITWPLSRPGMGLHDGEHPPWWVPDPEGLRRMVLSAGFDRVETTAQGYVAHRNTQRFLPPGTRRFAYLDGLRQAEETTDRTRRVTVLADGREYGEDLSGHVYVEFEREDTLRQWWVRREALSTAAETLSADPGAVAAYAKHAIGQDVLKRNRLGDRVRRLAGIGCRVSVKAYK